MEGVDFAEIRELPKSKLVVLPGQAQFFQKQFFVGHEYSCNGIAEVRVRFPFRLLRGAHDCEDN